MHCHVSGTGPCQTLNDLAIGSFPSSAGGKKADIRNLEIHKKRAVFDHVPNSTENSCARFEKGCDPDLYTVHYSANLSYDVQDFFG